MDAATTSLAPANSTRGEWARFGAFLKRPTLPARAPLPRLASLVASATHDLELDDVHEPPAAAGLGSGFSPGLGSGLGSGFTPHSKRDDLHVSPVAARAPSRRASVRWDDGSWGEDGGDRIEATGRDAQRGAPRAVRPSAAVADGVTLSA